MVLPWTLPDNEKGTPGAFHCDTCMKTSSQTTRAGLHCGWLPRAAWKPGRGDLPRRFGPDEYTVDVCPGWLVRQPAVIEGTEAYEAVEAGGTVLERFDPAGLRLTYQLAKIAKRAFNLYSEEKIKKLRRSGTPS